MNYGSGEKWQSARVAVLWAARLTAGESNVLIQSLVRMAGQFLFAHRPTAAEIEPGLFQHLLRLAWNFFPRGKPAPPPPLAKIVKVQCHFKQSLEREKLLIKDPLKIIWLFYAMCVNSKYIPLLTHYNNIVTNKCNSPQKFRLRKFDAKAFWPRCAARQVRFFLVPCYFTVGVIDG